jgi:hypothetical protein
LFVRLPVVYQSFISDIFVCKCRECISPDIAGLVGSRRLQWVDYTGRHQFPP